MDQKVVGILGGSAYPAAVPTILSTISDTTASRSVSAALPDSLMTLFPYQGEASLAACWQPRRLY